MNHVNRLFFILVFLINSIFFGCNKNYRNLDLSIYQYQDTKNLVRFVYNASLLLKKDGLQAIKTFKHKKYYSKNENYLYIYDLNGKNIYHGGMNYIKNKNLRNITDKNGKKIFDLIIQAINDKNNPHGWVHYSWWKAGKFFPVPKSSCNFKVTTPDGKQYFIGAGINYPHEEKEFIRIIVDDAVNLINKKGISALKIISNPLSEFNYRDIRTFIFTENNKILISPVADKGFFQINLIESTDEVGHRPFLKALKKIKNKNVDWEFFMAKNKYKRELIKKCLYIHKTNLNGKQIFVAAITDIPQPPS